MLALRPSEMERPAASSAPELMREPEESCWRLLAAAALVMLSWFSASSAEMLLRMLRAMGAPWGHEAHRG